MCRDDPLAARRLRRCSPSQIEAKARLFLLSGLDVAKNVHALNPDAIYVCSNFIRTAMKQSGTFTSNLFVTH